MRILYSNIYIINEKERKSTKLYILLYKYAKKIYNL